MKNKSTSIFIRAVHFFAIAFVLLLYIPAGAQVSTTYTFAQSAGTYTTLAGGTVVANTAMGNMDDNVTSVTMPSPFIFDGVSYSDINISTNGFVSFGGGSSSTEYNPISGTDPVAGIIAAFGGDLDASSVAGTPTIRYVQSGTEFVIQWTNYSRFADLDRLSFQIRLNTANNQIKIVYGGPGLTMDTDPTGLEVGLRGPNNTFPLNVNNRQVLPNSGSWVNSTAGTSNASTCDFDGTNPATTPTVGTTYTWTPPAVDLAASALAAPGTSGCYSAPQAVSVRIINSGSALINFATNPVTVNCSVTGPNPMTFTPVVVNTGTLAVNATLVVPIVLNYNMTLAGNYVFSASTSCAGDPHAGNNAMAPVTINSHTPSIAASADVSICTGTSTNLTSTAAAFPYTTTITNNTNLSIPDNVPAGVNQTMVVSGVSAAPSSVTITINNLTHTFDGDLIFKITAPNGSNVIFCNQEGGGGANFTNTVFSSSAVTPIASGAAPFTGSFLPDNPFSALTGTSNGNWVINVSDNAAADVGVLHSWSLSFSNTNSITTYAWSPTTGLSSSTIANPTANPTATTNYSVTVTDQSGCTNTDNVIVTVNPLPTVTANSTAASVCSGNSVTLTGGGATSYTWTGGVTNAVAFTPVSTNTYTVTGTDANGCVNTANTTVTVNPTPTVTATAGSPTICSGSSSTLTGSGASTYTWMPGSLSGTTVSVSPIVTTTYTVTGTSASGCTNTANVTVTVNPTPTVTATAGSPSICNGSSTSLTGNGASTYTWMPGSLSGTTVTVSPTATTTYTVTGTSAAGCSSTGNTTVTVNPIPTVTATAGSSAICNGSSTSLTGNGASTYTWMPGSLSGTTVTVSPTTTTTYTVTGTSAAGCSNTGNTTVTVNALPTVTANSTASSVCSGNSVTLSGGGATSYTWTGGVTNAVAFTPAATNTYTVTGTDANGCTNTANTTVTVNALPTVTANSSASTVCSGNSVTLSGSGAVSYSWTGGVTDAVAFTPASTNTYTVTGTDANGCTNTANTTVTVNPTPTVIATSPNPTICNGSSTTLNASGAVTYLWMPGSLSGSSVTVSPTTTTSYTVTGTDASGCSNTGLVGITVNSLPTVTANSTASTVCSGSSVTLSGSGAVSYSWTGGVTDAVAFNPTSTNTYTVTGTDANGCTGSDMTTVTVNSLPAVTANSSAAAVCAGNSVTLSGGGAVSYSWTGGVTDAVAFTPAATNTYTVTGTDANGCTNTANTTVTVNALPTVTANSTASTVCSGSSVTLSGSGAVSYSWTGGVTDAVAFNPTSTNTYTVTGTDANGCTGTDMTTVTVNSLPVVTINFPMDTVCLNGGMFALTGESPSGGIWSGNGVSGNSFDPTVPGVGFTLITYTYSDVNGCSAMDTSSLWVDICGGINNAVSAMNLNLYPNPNNGIFTLNIQNSKVSEVKLEIVDLQGQLVYSEMLNDVTDNFNKQLDLSAFANGSYFLKVTMGNETQVLKVFKQE